MTNDKDSKAAEHHEAAAKFRKAAADHAMKGDQAKSQRHVKEAQQHANTALNYTIRRYPLSERLHPVTSRPRHDEPNPRHDSAPSSSMEKPPLQRGRPPKETEIQKQRRSGTESSPVARLQRLSLRIKELRSTKALESNFADAPPSLPDAVCLAVLEANMARPNAPFTVSAAEWPVVRVEARWTTIFGQAILFLADLAQGHREMQASTTLNETGVEVELTLRHPEGAVSDPNPKAANALSSLDESILLIVTDRAACVRLLIPLVHESRGT